MIPVLLVFLLVTFGLAWPLASRLALDPAERLGATVALSLLGAYLGSFALYLLKLPPAAYWLLPLLGAAGLLAGRRALAAMLADADARGLLAGSVRLRLALQCVLEVRASSLYCFYFAPLVLLSFTP